MDKETEWLLREKYQGIRTSAFESDSIRLAKGEPLGYLIGHAPFLNCTIHLNSYPLIPRVETEFWVEKAIAEIATASNLMSRTPKILDLCAGSGAIGVAVAKAIPGTWVTFAELDPAHLPTITKNLTENISDYSDRMEQYSVVASDLFKSVLGQFDFILTNPPYIDKEALTVDANVEAHEPHLALFGGVAGMELITRIIAEAPEHLTAVGQLWIEHEPAQVAMITALAYDYGFSSVTHPDQYRIPRFSVLTVAQ